MTAVGIIGIVRREKIFLIVSFFPLKKKILKRYIFEILHDHQHFLFKAFKNIYSRGTNECAIFNSC